MPNLSSSIYDGFVWQGRDKGHIFHFSGASSGAAVAVDQMYSKKHDAGDGIANSWVPVKGNS